MATLQTVAQYTEASIKSLDWREHIRLRPGMYIGKLGDGSSPDDGIYVLLKETIDNSIDEFMMGFGRLIEVKVTKHSAMVRDYGRGIPLGKVYDCVARINTGGKYDTEVFQKSIGLNGIGSKAVNALSKYFKVQAIRDGKTKIQEFEYGILKKDHKIKKTDEKNGTFILFEPDPEIFKNFQFRLDFIENQIKNYVYLNAGLTISLNGKRFQSKNGLLDLLNDKLEEGTARYPIIHLRGKDIEIALTHTNQYGEDYYSFVNGQYTPQGGTHQAAFREGVIKTVREFYKKNFESMDIRASIAGAIAVRIQEPVFESQTKTKLGSTHMAPDGPTVRNYVVDFIKTELDNY
ncbi:MAG TPA: type IIA DNA topoisomerase subunit B, partial [Caldithrix abyssi]|nr:type IIA DNA topoisomerase subunit B [Caldithrix abyssi]